MAPSRQQGLGSTRRPPMGPLLFRTHKYKEYIQNRSGVKGSRGQMGRMDLLEEPNILIEGMHLSFKAHSVIQRVLGSGQKRLFADSVAQIQLPNSNSWRSRVQVPK